MRLRWTLALLACLAVRQGAALEDRVGFDQRLGEHVPLDLVLRDSRGAEHSLRSLLDSRPALLVPGYYDCTNLCGAVRAGLAHAIAGTDFAVGDQFNVILVSIDPRERTADAARAQRHDRALDPRAGITRWLYTTAAPQVDAQLMRAIGFRYRFDSISAQYVHPAGLVVLDARGAIVQYLFGVAFVPRTLHLALANASAGRLGSLIDRFVLLCCSYDPQTGRYSLIVSRVLQALGVVTALAVAALILILRRGEPGRADSRRSA